MHIVLLHQYHHNPDCPATCRHYDICGAWIEHGHSVTIISSDAWRRKRLTNHYPWVPPGVDLVELKVSYDNEMGVGRRMGAFAYFAVKSLMEQKRLTEPDVIIGTSPPLSVAWAAERIARQRRVPFVFEVQDLWPDFPIEMGAIKSRRLRSVLWAKEKALYKAADAVVALSPGIAEHVHRRGVAAEGVTTVLQGTDLQLAGKASERRGPQLREAHQIEDQRVVLYAGTLGRANDIPTLMSVARDMSSRHDLNFVFLGHGFYSEDVRRLAQSVSNVTVVEPTPRHQIFDWFATADVSIVSFVDVPSVAAGSPSKLFDSLSTGCPVIVTNPGWTKALVEENKCGWYAPAQDPDALAATIARALADPAELARAGSNGMRLARERFDRNQLAEDFENILVEVIDQHTRRLQ